MRTSVMAEPVPFWLVDFVLAWFILFPAYAANGFPVLAHGKRALDFGRMLNGKRVFGDSKTIEGTAVGIVAGFLIGALEFYLLPGLQLYADQFSVQLPNITLAVALAISVGAMAGDVLGSFIKRRRGIPPGAPAPVLDQLGFVVFAIVFVAPFINLTWLMAVYMLVFTFVIHRISNYLSYKLRLKKVPW